MIKKSSKEQMIALRKRTGLNRKEYSKYLNIPYPTITDWEMGNRHAPIYLYELIKEKGEKDFPIRKD